MPASSVIRHLDDLPTPVFNEDEPPSLLVVPYMRVSSGEQRGAGHLERRLKYLRLRLRIKGVHLTKSYTEVVSGKVLMPALRPELVNAIAAAQELQSANPDAVVAVVSDTRNRLVRGPNYDGSAETDNPTNSQLKRLRQLAGSVILATGILHPDAPFDEVRSYETRVSQKFGKRVGRPEKQEPGWMKKRRLALMPKAVTLRKRGKSLRRIGRLLKVPFTTVADWLKGVQL
jgi:hypothetical protein